MNEEDEDLGLIRASASLLDDLERSLPRLLYKQRKNEQALHRAHSLVRQKDLDHVIKLIEPFQGDPQLLDPHLKNIIPQSADALLQHLTRDPKPAREGHIDLTLAASTVLYTLCKVRGRKIVSSLLHNEPRHLELILTSLERLSVEHEQWQVQSTLLLWLSHLLLAPFNLESISLEKSSNTVPHGLHLCHRLPDLAQRSVQVCLRLINSPSISREIAALTLVRLAIRPDMQNLQLADALVDWALSSLGVVGGDSVVELHTQLGAMHFLVGIAKSADLEHLLPKIFRACESIFSNETTQTITTDAVGRKLLLKTMSNIMITSLRTVSTSTLLSTFLDESGALETTIENQLQCLADRESLVRNAAAKATSNIILALDAPMAREVLQALLSSLSEHSSDSDVESDLQTANAFAWHGNVLTLAYALFKRSVPNDQLPALITILLKALAFEQRTATGSVTGTNVRDAANFGLWSLARRTTTAELSCVDSGDRTTVISQVATRLVQSSCLDPVGNIRRGSSAALQELVGRHPNEVSHGIALVQAVDFVAVGLRQRAMIDVAASAMALDQLYWDTLAEGLIAWRGLGSSDAASREYAATSLITRTIARKPAVQSQVVERLIMSVQRCQQRDFERLHGLVLSFALYVDSQAEAQLPGSGAERQAEHIWTVLEEKGVFEHGANLTNALIKFITAYCKLKSRINTSSASPPALQRFVKRLLTSFDDNLLEVVPGLIWSLHLVGASADYECIRLSSMTAQLSTDITRPSLNGAARAFAIGATLGSSSNSTIVLEQIIALRGVCSSTYVDWRIVGYKAVNATINISTAWQALDERTLALLVDTVASGLQDYAIDQRGDIGSLVRLEALNCASVLCTTSELQPFSDILLPLHAGIARLSLEKLNRVRARAALCRSSIPGDIHMTSHIDDVDSEAYFCHAIAPLWDVRSPQWLREALLQGLPSCAGIASEHLTQTARAVVNKELSVINLETLQSIAEDIVGMLMETTTRSTNAVPILELISFLLQARILQRLIDSDFKWRRLLAQVQTAHYKSTDMSRLLVVVSVYACLAEIRSVRQDVLKKLLSMLKTNPYPKVRAATADALFLATRDEALKASNWHLPPSQHTDVLSAVYERHIGT